MGDNRTTRKEYLTVYDYGTGAVWYYITASSPDEILKKYPKLEVLEKEPDWFDGAIRNKILHADVNDKPGDFLKRMIYDSGSVNHWVGGSKIVPVRGFSQGSGECLGALPGSQLL